MQATLAGERVAPDGGVPIRFFLTPDLMPDDVTLRQLDQLAATPGLDHYVAVLPDVHQKGRNISPTGVVTVSRNAIAPRAVDTGVSCGMRVLVSDIEARDLTPAVLDRLFSAFMLDVPLERGEDVLSEGDAEAILATGAGWCRRALGVGDEELARIEDGGSAVAAEDADAVLAAVPRKAVRKGRRRFCTIGAGNHFLEAQEIVEVFDERRASALGLRPGAVAFMLHSDSRGVGGTIMRRCAEAHAEKFAPEGSNGGFWSMPADSEEGVALALGLAGAMNFGFANRVAISERLRATVRNVLGHQSIKLPLLYDCAHVSIKRETWKGEPLWVHRHGASRALPPSRLAGDPTLSITGQPVPIPGSMGHDSFIGAVREEAVDSFYSVNHGAGRLLDKPDALARFTESEVEQEMRRKNIRLYRYGSDNIAEQAPGSFKDIDDVIRAMAVSPIMDPVVRLRPLAVLKG
jgi:tRNA-splicing ligase RtcB